MNRLFKFFSLEVGLVCGVLLTLAGLFGSGWAVWIWSTQSFGPLEPSQTLRIVIPSTLALTLGCQIILFSFFFSILGLQVRKL